MTLFECLDLHAAIIREIWMGEGSQDLCNELKDLQEIGMIHRLRKVTDAAGKRRGGVGIFYNTNKMKLSNFHVPVPYEIVAAVEKIHGNTRLIATVATDFPPQMRARQMKRRCLNK